MSLAPGSRVASGQGRRTAIEADLRIGYGLPAGQAAEGALADTFAGVMPLIFGLGYRLHPRVSVGGYFQYGIGSTNNEPEGWARGFCSRSGYSCPSSVVRWGADIRFRVLPHRRLDPFLGVGTGYEKASADIHPRNYGGEYMGDVHWTASGLSMCTWRRGPTTVSLGAWRLAGSPL